MLEHNRDAVITIQGGGAYGLTLLGQLQTVIEQHRYTPLALAGTSAGAVLATLLWAGYRPSEIRAEFVRIAETEKDGLISFLGRFEPPPTPQFGFQEFLSLRVRLDKLIHSITARQKLSWRDCVPLYRIARDTAPHFKQRGLFRGDVMEEHIERLLRDAPGVPKDIAPLGEPLRFRHFEALAWKRREEAYRPPLLLTATNLAKSRLEVISSVDPRYTNVPIAKAVRASAGFPVVFRPRELAEAFDGGWFVDGGVVSNFPVWTFSDAFRQQLLRLPLYRELASLPWIRIGLRVVDDRSKVTDLTEPARFFGALIGMMRGTARNQLEEILSARAARAIIIRQPVSETGLADFLDLTDLSPSRINALLDRGANYADERLRRIASPGIFRSALDSAEISGELQVLVERCIRVMNIPEGDLKFRSNVFVPIEDRMKLLFNYNMAGDADREIEFPDLQSGLTGFCYTSRRPQLCNLTEIRKVRRSGRPEHASLFGMDQGLQEKVKEDRTWLASVPIFDPYEVTLSPSLQRPAGEPKYEGKAYRGMETLLDGPILGVLNLDSGWDYHRVELDTDPDVHFADTRIQAMLGLMQAAASSIARRLIEFFPAQGDDHG